MSVDKLGLVGQLHRATIDLQSAPAACCRVVAEPGILDDDRTTRNVDCATFAFFLLVVVCMQLAPFKLQGAILDRHRAGFFIVLKAAVHRNHATKEHVKRSYAAVHAADCAALHMQLATIDEKRIAERDLHEVQRRGSPANAQER